ncbi:MAG TPA: SPOR domain-containing protein [Firmicutes bacterium]|nr:SPOR domain-containing protein [Bacillota bacterium]
MAGGGRGESALLVISLVIFGVVAIGLGYLLGEYALRMIMKPPAKEGQSVVTVSEGGGAPGGTNGSTGKEGQAQPGAKPGLSTAQGTGEGTGSIQELAPGGATAGVYRVQVGAFTERANADRLAGELKAQGYEVYVTGEPPFRVQVGAFSRKENATSLANELKGKGYQVYVAGDSTQ